MDSDPEATKKEVPTEDKAEPKEPSAAPKTEDAPAPEERKLEERPSPSVPLHSPKPKTKRKKLKIKMKSLATVAVVLLLVVAISSWFMGESTKGAVIDKDKYQAVFLGNGQVYFGKLHKVNDEYMKLTEVYYLQAEATDQAVSEENSANPQDTDNPQTPDIQLIKLGSEVHGPEDEMVISEGQILFFENLKKDGKVSASIENYQKNQKK